MLQTHASVDLLKTIMIASIEIQQQQQNWMEIDFANQNENTLKNFLREKSNGHFCVSTKMKLEKISKLKYTLIVIWRQIHT